MAHTDTIIRLIAVGDIVYGAFVGRGVRIDARNTTNGSIVHSVSVGLNPNAIAVDERTGRVFVTSRWASTEPGSVSVLDARRGTILHAITVSPAPAAITVAERAGRVFVVSSGTANNGYAGSVSTLDATNGAMLRTVIVGQSPNAVTVDEAMGRVFVTSMTSRGATLSTLDAIDGAVLRAVTIGAYVRPIAVAAGAGRVIVVTSDDRAHVLDAASGHAVHLTRVGQGAGSIALDAVTRRAFVVNQNSNTVSVLDTVDGNIVRTVAVGVAPATVAVDETTGRAFVANTGDNTVSVLDATSGALLHTVAVGVGLLGYPPLFVTLAVGIGRVVVASDVSLSVLDADSGAVLSTSSADFAVTAVAVDGRTGRAFVANGLTSMVHMLNLLANRRLGLTPVGASYARTRAVLQAFIDAYNSHDIAAVLALLGNGFQYGDCDVANRVAFDLRTKTDVAAWLRARFAERDRFEQVTVNVGSGGDPPNDPRIAGLAFLRTNDSLRAQGRILDGGAKVILTKDGGRISTMALTSTQLCAASH